MKNSFFNEDISEDTSLSGSGASQECINPCNGVSMLNGCGEDVEGNPYDTDLYDNWSPDLWPDDE